ncbi:unnamed protein product [Heterobilharzia americana]|nr:unnamed protein product [Heterobilharzia americana]
MMQLEETHKLQNPIDFDSENILNEIKTSVHNLYEFKNKYLNEWADKYGVFNDSMTELWMRNDTIHSMINESCELVRKKNEIIQSKFEDTISVLKKYEAMFTHVSALEKAEFCYQYGRVFNAIDSNLYAGNLNDMEENDLTCQAIQWLTKALKFNPQHLDAWCELGDSCWRQGDPVQAAEHFRQALKIDPKHVNALCHLSMVIRQLPILNNNDDDNVLNELNSSQSYTKSSIFSQSVDLAHTAVGQQPTNGHAWSILGNALLTMFFKRYGSIAPYPLISQSYSFNVKNANNDDNNKTVTESTVIKSPVTSSQIIMTRCLAAYSQAVKDRSTALEPSFHYNRGSAWHYQGIFGQTLRCWLQAVCLDPDWSAPQNGIKHNSNTEGKPDKELTSSVLKNSTNQELLNRNQQQQQINEFILPLSPLNTLLSIEHTNLSTSQVDQLDKDIKLTLDMKDIMALNRLMGPYCPSVSNANNTNDKNDILLSTEKRKGGSKKRNV